MTPGLVEYVALRMVRRFLVPERVLKRVGGFVPYYRTNLNEVDPRPVIELYERSLARAGLRIPPDPVILEIGSGATNSVGYALAQGGLAGSTGRVLLHEPYAELDREADERHRAGLAAGVYQRVERISTLAGVDAGSVDLILSHSVLEHLRDPAATIAELERVLAPSGVMLHVVDYRDHFFKYPFHFLLFSRASWERWLDPGDLPRWRLGDHLRMLRDRGLRADVLDTESLPREFAQVRERIHPDFDRADPNVAVARATLLVRREVRV